jgi:hypothetical protein
MILLSLNKFEETPVVKVLQKSPRITAALGRNHAIRGVLVSIPAVC